MAATLDDVARIAEALPDVTLGERTSSALRDAWQACAPTPSRAESRRRR
jgi:hypothetical protein